MKKWICTTIILLLALCSACTQETPMKIGFVGCLTGANSELGVNGMYGAMIAVDEINASGGVHNRLLELIIKDDKGNPDVGLQADKALVKDECIAIVGHMTSDMAEKSIPYINREEMIMISPTIALAALSNKDDFFFRLIPSTKEQAKQFASVIQKIDVKDVLIVSSKQNAVFAQSIYNDLSSTLSEGIVRLNMMDPIDFNSQIDVDEKVNSIAASKAEAILVIASADSVVRVSHALTAEGDKKSVFLPAWAMTNDLLKKGGSSVNRFYGVSFIDYQSDTKKYEDFRNEYVRRFGDEPTFASIMSYEAVMMLADAMRSSSNFEPEQLKRQILSNETFQGLQGDILLNQYGDAERDIFLYQIVDNQFVKVNADE